MNRTGPDWLHDRIAAGELVIIDGATGSELEARGVPMVQKGWSVLAQLEYPDVLRALHEDYIRSGASVVITNTFGAGRHLTAIVFVTALPADPVPSCGCARSSSPHPAFREPS